jgi:hypothetical protein
MAELKIDFFRDKPFAVRLTDQEIEAVANDFDTLFDGDRNIRPRQAFMMLVDKALYNIKKINESSPADKQHIEDLEKELKELKERNALISSQLNSAVELKEDAERRLNTELQNSAGLTAEIDNYRLTIAEFTGKQPEISEKPLASNERLLVLNPLENFVLKIIEDKHQTTAKDILINRFFMVYQKRGNGDYDIKRINPAKYAEIENLAKSSQ